jgi:hypothetical protein
VPKLAQHRFMMQPGAVVSAVLAAMGNAVIRRPVSGFAGLAAFGLLVCFPIVIGLHLDRGIDVSDAGYYHASISYLHDNAMAVTQFGVIWNVLPLPETIWIRRLALLILVSLASGWMALEALALAGSTGRYATPLADRLIFAGIGLGAGTFYASLWLVDPSYNAMAVGLSCGLVALALRYANHSAQAVVSLVIAGILIVFLLYARQPTAAAIGLILASFVVIMVRPDLPRLAGITGLAVLGMVIGVGLIWIRVEAPSVSLDRFEAGLELAEVLARDINQLDRLQHFLGALGALAARHWYLLALAFAAFAAPGHLKPVRSRLGRLALAALPGMSLVTVVAWQLADLPDRASAQYAFQSQVAALAGLMAVAIGLGCLVGARSRRQRRLAMRRLGIVIVLVLSAVAVIYWTGSLWFPRLSIVAVMPILALLVAAYTPHRFRFAVHAVAIVVVTAMVQLVAWQAMSMAPYRLDGSLQAQRVSTPLRHGQSTLLTDERTHHLLTALSQASAGLKECRGDARPVLLDLTGRMPLVAYHVNARPPGRSWVLSGYPGSKDLFEFVVSRLDDETLSRAWVLDAPDFDLRHDIDVLAQRGIDFERTHELRAQAFAPYPGVQVRLYAPPGPGCQSVE